LFDFLGDLTGQSLSVECLAPLRGEMKFPSLAALVRQLRLDEGRARTQVARARWLA
jgi:riboflavin kinase/FMN adenylyltransferase